jgi:hypothetical protein
MIKINKFVASIDLMSIFPSRGPASCLPVTNWLDPLARRAHPWMDRSAAPGMEE